MKLQPCAVVAEGDGGLFVGHAGNLVREAGGQRIFIGMAEHEIDKIYPLVEDLVGFKVLGTVCDVFDKGLDVRLMSNGNIRAEHAHVVPAAKGVNDGGDARVLKLCADSLEARRVCAAAR